MESGKEMLQVIKRNGETTDFTLTKISDAIIKAFRATDVQYSNDVVDLLTLRVTADFQSHLPHRAGDQAGICHDADPETAGRGHYLYLPQAG